MNKMTILVHAMVSQKISSSLMIATVFSGILKSNFKNRNTLYDFIVSDYANNIKLNLKTSIIFLVKNLPQSLRKKLTYN